MIKMDKKATHINNIFIFTIYAIGSFIFSMLITFIPALFACSIFFDWPDPIMGLLLLGVITIFLILFFLALSSIVFFTNE